MNSGEGGFLTTDNPDIAARAVLLSGSYMFYKRHGARAPDRVFEDICLNTPNYSGRMDNLRAAIIRSQISSLDANCQRWNERYRVLEDGLDKILGVTIPKRCDNEFYVGSSIQFRLEDLDNTRLSNFVAKCSERGLDIKWFGEPHPRGFTSRYDSWHYLGNPQRMPNTLSILQNTFDMRVPLTFEIKDCEIIVGIIAEVISEMTQ